MKKTISQIGFSSIFLIAWLIFSIIYIGFDLWKDGLKLSQNIGQQQGYQLAFVELIAGVTKECQPLEIKDGKSSVQIINVECLQATEKENQASEISEESTQ